MKRELILALLIMLTVFLTIHSVDAKSIVVEFNIYKNDTIVIDDISASYSDTLLPSDNGEYLLSLNDIEDNVLFSSNFDVYMETNNVVESYVYWRLPFPDTLTFININKGRKLLHRIDISDYLCDKDYICESYLGENYPLCPQDCEEDTQETNTIQEYWTYIILILIIVVIVLFVMVLGRRRPKKSKKWDSVYRKIREPNV